MSTFHLRIERDRHIPQEGETIHMQGLGGVYIVKIKHILKRKVHPDDGAILMKVKGKKRLVQEVTS